MYRVGVNASEYCSRPSCLVAVGVCGVPLPGARCVGPSSTLVFGSSCGHSHIAANARADECDRVTDAVLPKAGQNPKKSNGVGPISLGNPYVARDCPLSSSVLVSAGFRRRRVLTPHNFSTPLKSDFSG